MVTVLPEFALFTGTFSTMLAIINPLEVLPVYLQFMDGKDRRAQRLTAFKACLYATGLAFFFLIFGNVMLRIFGVPLPMLRIVGGLILMRIGFSLFDPQPGSMVDPSAAKGDVAFVPLAMPLMFGPGAIAVIIGMTSLIRSASNELRSFFAVALAIVATMIVTYACLANAVRLTKAIGPMAVDAATRIVGVFVAAIGVGLAFNGVIQALQLHEIIGGH